MRPLTTLFAAGLFALPSSSFAWGYQGHKIVAEVARSYLAPGVQAKVDAILGADTDNLTKHDMAAEATWADAYRGAGHRETAQWHFVDEEIDGSADLKAACFGFPAANQPASAGPAQDCVVDKINEFTAELAAPDITPAEQLVALKFVLHFVGDVHQPLHASDNHDRGGDCVLVSLGPTRTANLHAIWDTVLVNALGTDPEKAAAELRSHITPAQAKAWQQGDAGLWAAESFAIAINAVYSMKTPAGCASSPTPIELPKGYEATGEKVVAVQIARAGVRLAAVLNKALGPAPMTPRR